MGKSELVFFKNLTNGLEDVSLKCGVQLLPYTLKEHDDSGFFEAKNY